jgi:hypothetical protein
MGGSPEKRAIAHGRGSAAKDRQVVRATPWDVPIDSWDVPIDSMTMRDGLVTRKRRYEQKQLT